MRTRDIILVSKNIYSNWRIQLCIYKNPKASIDHRIQNHLRRTSDQTRLMKKINENIHTHAHEKHNKIDEYDDIILYQKKNLYFP